MTPKQVSIDDNADANRSLNVIDEGDGQPILFVHGFPLDLSSWRKQFQLANQFRIIVPDLAGFGNSERPDSELTLKGFADDLAKLLEALKVTTPVAICGLSMGGYVGWQFWKDHSQLVSHVVACDTRAANDSEEVARGRKIAAESVRKTGSGPVAHSMIGKLIYQSDHADKQEVTESVHQVISQTDPESIAQGQLAMAARPNATPWLKDINVPALFVVGEHDEITPPDEMRANAEAVSGSSFLQIENAGHLAPLENPKAFNKGLVEFLQSNVT